jgi:hypothetical protein
MANELCVAEIDVSTRRRGIPCERGEVPSAIGFNGVTGGLKVFRLVASIALPSLGKAQVPVFVVTPEDSSIKFFVKHRWL